MSARSIDTLSGLALLALAAVFFSQTVGAFPDQPLARNPMTVPRFLLGLLAAGGGLLVARGLSGRAAPGGEAGSVVALNWGAILPMGALVALYLYAFTAVGFLAATVVFIPAACLALGYRRAAVIVPVTAIAVPLIWYLFAEGFSIRPPGTGLDTLLRMLGGGS